MNPGIKGIRHTNELINLHSIGKQLLNYFMRGCRLKSILILSLIEVPEWRSSKRRFILFKIWTSFAEPMLYGEDLIVIHVSTVDRSIKSTVHSRNRINHLSWFIFPQ